MNRQNFLFKRDACLLLPYLIPKYAKTVSIKRDGYGYWLNVSWDCGVTAPLTINEMIQALGERKC